MNEPPAARLQELAPNTVIDGDFTVEVKIGEGGMGAVYAVHQRSTGAWRALKVMGSALLQAPRSWERFEREACVCARIRSEHVVKVIRRGGTERCATERGQSGPPGAEGSTAALQLRRPGAQARGGVLR